MRLYLSGGSPIPEVTLNKPDIMLSYYADVKNNKPNARFRILLRIRKIDRLTKILDRVIEGKKK